jgi:N-terminal domain of anti-restriction factor ArdC
MAVSAASTSPNQPSTNPKANPVQQLIKESVDFLIEQLRQGKSETLTAYLNAMARFHSYSFGNILAIAHARPNATHVAGIRTWNKLGRFVNKGEKGIPILAPMIRAQKQKHEESQEPSEKPAHSPIGFRKVWVFDILQTHGRDLPKPATVSGEVGGYLDRLIGFVHQQGIELEYNERIAPAMGVSYGGRIALLPGQSKAETFSTLVHELAHEALHRAERRSITSKTARETEAEAIAFIVDRAVGLNTSSASADYIALYNGNAELLIESLAVIQEASALILAALLSEVREPFAQAG